MTSSERSGARTTPSHAGSARYCLGFGQSVVRTIHPDSTRMPTYEYRCPDGHEFELFQSMSADPMAPCPQCGEAAQRLLSGGAGFIFKGDGFYITDSRSEAYKKAASSDQEGGGTKNKKSDSSSASDTSKSGESKSESKSSTSSDSSGPASSSKSDK